MLLLKNNLKYITIEDHHSEFPEPITFFKENFLVIHEMYTGPEDWDDWYFCHTEDLQKGRVPGQIIEWIDALNGRAVEDYTARELEVNKGDILITSRTMNGWIWGALV